AFLVFQRIYYAKDKSFHDGFCFNLAKPGCHRNFIGYVCSCHIIILLGGTVRRGGFLPVNKINYFYSSDDLKSSDEFMIYGTNLYCKRGSSKNLALRLATSSALAPISLSKIEKRFFSLIILGSPSIPAILDVILTASSNVPSE